MIKYCCRWPLLLLLTITACPIALADMPVEIYGPAPDPGDPPRAVPLGFVAVSIVCAVIAVIFLVRGYARGRIAWEPTFISAFAVLLFTVVGLAIAMYLRPPSEDYQKWQEAHQKWQDKETVIIGYEPSGNNGPPPEFD